MPKDRGAEHSDVDSPLKVQSGSGESTTFSESTFAILQERVAAKVSMKSSEGRSKDFLRDLQETSRNKPHSAPANQVFGTTEHAMLPDKHTWELSSQPSREFWTRFGLQP